MKKQRISIPRRQEGIESWEDLDFPDYGNTVKPHYNAGRGRKNIESKNRVIARSALQRGFPMVGFFTIKRPNAKNISYF